MSLSLSNWYPGSGRYLIVSIPDLCTLTYFDFEIIDFPFLDGDVPRSTSYGLYLSTHSFGYLEHQVMLLTSALAINC